jgi:hypothetical protein
MCSSVLHSGGSASSAVSEPVGHAHIVSADITCSNGVIQIIDEIVQPPQSLENTLKAANLTDAHAILVQSGMVRHKHIDNRTHTCRQQEGDERYRRSRWPKSPCLLS